MTNTDYDQNYYRLRIRTRKWAERQTVSLLELPGLSPKRKAGRKRLRALWKGEVQTAETLASTPVDDLMAILADHTDCAAGPEAERARVVAWKDEIERLWSERGGRRCTD